MNLNPTSFYLLGNGAFGSRLYTIPPHLLSRLAFCSGGRTRAGWLGEVVSESEMVWRGSGGGEGEEGGSVVNDGCCKSAFFVAWRPRPVSVSSVVTTFSIK